MLTLCKKNWLIVVAILVVHLVMNWVVFAAEAPPAPPELDFPFGNENGGVGDPPELEGDGPADNGGVGDPPALEGDGPADNGGDVDPVGPVDPVDPVGPVDPVDPDPPPVGEIKFLSANVDPKIFNPILEDTKLTYSISKNAKVDIQVIDHTGVKVVELMIDEEIEGSKSNILWWGGKNTPDDSGEVLPPGKYNIKLIVKNLKNGQVSDSKTLEVELLYTPSNGEGSNNGESNDNGGGNGPSNGNGGVNNNGSATVILQNNPPDNTAGTGMPIVIYYFFIPFAFLSSYLFQKNLL